MSFHYRSYHSRSFHSRSFDSSSKITAAGAADHAEVGIGRAGAGTVVGSAG